MKDVMHTEQTKTKTLYPICVHKLQGKSQFLNPKHLPSDHGKRNTGRVINFLTRIRHKEKEEKDGQSEDEGIVEDEEEGWSYDAGNRVMCLTQRTAQQMPSLSPTMEIWAKPNLFDRDILRIILYCDTDSCLN